MPDLAEVFRREAGRCTATLIRILGDVDLAEDAVAEAFAIAAQQWPTHGVPPNPGGWITTTARNRAVDRLRREATRADRHLAARRLGADDMAPDHDPELGALDDFVDVVADDQLRLLFLCCHPALAADAQVALTLRLLGGLATGALVFDVVFTTFNFVRSGTTGLVAQAWPDWAATLARHPRRSPSSSFP